MGPVNEPGIIAAYRRTDFRMIAIFECRAKRTNASTRLCPWGVLERDMSDRAHAVPTVAVLPFDSAKGDREQEHLAECITDALITDLARLSGLSVIARQSVLVYRGSVTGACQISGDLGAQFILEGSVRCVGKRVRINTQLIDGASGRHVWADRSDHDTGDIFELQDTISARVVDLVKARLPIERNPSVGRRSGVRKKRKAREP